LREEITVRLLEPGHLEEDYQSPRFLKIKDSQIFLQTGPVKFQENFAAVENFKTV